MVKEDMQIVNVRWRQMICCHNPKREQMKGEDDLSSSPVTVSGLSFCEFVILLGWKSNLCSHSMSRPFVSCLCVLMFVSGLSSLAYVV